MSLTCGFSWYHIDVEENPENEVEVDFVYFHLSNFQDNCFF